LSIHAESAIDIHEDDKVDEAAFKDLIRAEKRPCIRKCGAVGTVETMSAASL
jgi:hypothetical protein